MTEVAQAPAAADAVTAGMLLRRAREAAGLHVAALAVSLKVPVRKLEALEEDRHDLLPDAVFVRALASSVCRSLKIDPQPVLELLPRTSKPRLVQDNDGINTPFRSPGEGPKSGWPEQLSRPVVLTVAALLVAALLVVFLPVTSGEGSSAAKNEPVMPPGTPSVVTAAPAEPRGNEAAGNTSAGGATLASAPAPAPVPAVVSTPPATPPAQAAPVRPAPAAAAVAPAAATPAPSAAAASPSVAAAAPLDAAAAASGVVVFRTRGASWIAVTDAKGTEVLRRLMAAGETVGVSGAVPLSVTVGSAETTEVLVRGKPFNLAPVSKDNVARFQVK